SHHSAQSQALRLPPHEPAVPHPLHPSVHAKSHRGHPLLLAVLRHASTIPPHVHSGDRRQDRQQNEHRPPPVRLRLLIQPGAGHVLLPTDEPPHPRENGAPNQR